MNLENFFGFDQGEGMSESAFEAFKEQMRAAAAQIAAIKKEEGKQKKKEEELLKILLKFVKTSQKKDLVMLISRALEQNIPANFILAIILLDNEEIEREVGGSFMLKAGQGTAQDLNQEDQEHAMIFFGQDDSMPLKIKIELDAWMKTLLLQAEEKPEKLLKTAYDIEMIEIGEEKYEDEYYEEHVNKKYNTKRTVKVILIQLVAFILRDYLDKHEIDSDYEKLSKFAEFIIKGILEKTEESFKNRKLLKN